MSEVSIVPDQPLATTTKKPGGVTGKGFMPGVSGNKRGRPKGFASYVQKRTKDGKTLVDFAMDVMEGKPLQVEQIIPASDPGKPPIVIRYEITAPPKVRLEAMAWLAERGYGKITQPLDLNQPKPFLVQHRVLAPGTDPLALEGEVGVGE